MPCNVFVILTSNNRCANIVLCKLSRIRRKQLIHKSLQASTSRSTRHSKFNSFQDKRGLQGHKTGKRASDSRCIFGNSVCIKLLSEHCVWPLKYQNRICREQRSSRHYNIGTDISRETSCLYEIVLFPGNDGSVNGLYYQYNSDGTLFRILPIVSSVQQNDDGVCYYCRQQGKPLITGIVTPTVTYSMAYNPFGQMTEFACDGNAMAQYTYAPNGGKLKKVAYTNGYVEEYNWIQNMEGMKTNHEVCQTVFNLCSYYGSLPAHLSVSCWMQGN